MIDWISVKSAKPEGVRNVFIIDNRGVVATGWYDRGYDEWYLCPLGEYESRHISKEIVTHWAEIPNLVEE